MDLQQIAKKLEGLQTIETIAKKLGVSRRTAVNLVWNLRKNGLVETGYSKRKIRWYRINPLKKPEIGFKGLYDIINENSKVGLFSGKSYKIHGRKLSIEEAIVRAVKEQEFRTILAAIGLFQKKINWPDLLSYAKKENVARKIGALYDVARTVIKTRKMDNRTRAALHKGKISNRCIIKDIRSKDFKEIEKEWNVFIPFNKSDLERYKE